MRRESLMEGGYFKVRHFPQRLTEQTTQCSQSSKLKNHKKAISQTKFNSQ